MSASRLALAALWLAFLGACGSSTPSEDTENPPVQAAALDAWIAKGFYKDWKCESTKHPGSAISPHGANRICSNAVASTHGTGPYPVGTAAVKELFDTSGAISGVAVYAKQTEGACDSYFYYEKMGGAVAAEGIGAAACVGCHTGAGSDAMHAGHDCVYTQVK